MAAASPADCLVAAENAVAKLEASGGGASQPSIPVAPEAEKLRWFLTPSESQVKLVYRVCYNSKLRLCVRILNLDYNTPEVKD